MSDTKTILLTFEDEETADYVRTVCRRKGDALESYILDNFEWDDNPECIAAWGKKITKRMCSECEENEHCPDVVKGKKKVRRK